jgi:hypothetical protein
VSFSWPGGKSCVRITLPVIKYCQYSSLIYCVCVINQLLAFGPSYPNRWPQAHHIRVIGLRPIISVEQRERVAEWQTPHSLWGGVERRAPMQRLSPPLLSCRTSLAAEVPQRVVAEVVLVLEQLLGHPRVVVAHHRA